MIRARSIAFAAIVAVVVVGAALVMGSGSDTYRLGVGLQTANGLREGGVVKVAGAEVGTIKELRLARNDAIVAELELDEKQAGRMGGDASARVLASNLLGSKYIELDPGTRRGSPATWIRSQNVHYPVDLDQVLNVLDADTRTRLQILINESGIALTGRHADFNVILRQLPRDFAAAERFLDRVTADNRALGEAVARSSEFVTRLARERRSLARVVEVTDSAMTAVSRRRANLRATLARAPRTLATTQAFLADLRSAAIPLRPAARAITASASPLTAALQQLPAFRRAAAPTLSESRHVAPLLTLLGHDVTPVLQRSLPTLSSLASFARTSVPLSRTLDASANDINGLMEGWARSIQEGDALSHIFRGKAIASAEALRTILAQDLPRGRPRSDAGGKRSGPGPKLSPDSTPSRKDGGQTGSPKPGGGLHLGLPKLPSTELPLPKLGPGDSDGRSDARQLLDFLLAP